MRAEEGSSTVPPEGAALFETFDVVECLDGEWIINGKEQSVSEEDEEDREDEIDLAVNNCVPTCVLLRTHCPHCGALFERDSCFLTYDGEIVDCKEAGKLRGGNDEGSYELVSCPVCAYWLFYADEDYTTVYAASVVRSFAESLPDGCRAELAQALARHPNRWHDINSTYLEHLVADIFRANFSQAEVIHVGKRGDLGVDVVFVDAGRRQWLMQVKGRQHLTAAEPFDTLLKLVGTMYIKESNYGIIVTTADHFSPTTIDINQSLMNRGFRIELVDGGKLARMMKAYLPSHAWSAVIQELPDRLSAALGEHYARKFTNTRQMSLFEQLGLFRIS